MPWGEIHQIFCTSTNTNFKTRSECAFVFTVFRKFFFSKQQCQQAQVNTKCQKNSSNSWHITDCVVFHSSQVKIDTVTFFQRLNLFFDSYRTRKEEIVTHLSECPGLRPAWTYFFARTAWSLRLSSFFSVSSLFLCAPLGACLLPLHLCLLRPCYVGFFFFFFFFFFSSLVIHIPFLLSLCLSC